MKQLCYLAILPALLFLLATAAAQQTTGQAPDDARRRASLEELKRILPPSPEWEAWLEESGELPPDFAAMRSLPAPPNPLVRHLETGEEVLGSTEAWEAHRPQVQREVQRWLTGTVPPRPDNLVAEVTSERREQGVTVREVLLKMGPEHAAQLRLEVFIPDGDGPHPVFITQQNHRPWGLIALRRGYLTVVYAGADILDDTASFIEAYSGHDWSKLMRRAWAASRCIDYLESVPQADQDRIALTGHSRNGKTSLMAAAMDTRIAAVISSSSGAGGSLSARLYSEQHFGEGIELITRRFPDWFPPRLRFYVGHEDKLPVDFHHLIALVAPRACLLSIALHDNVEDTWALERTYHLNTPVYDLYEASDKLQILYRPGGHETSPVEIERFVDWLDNQFGRGNYPLPDRLIHPHDWEGWSARAKHLLNPADYPARGLERVGMLPDGTPIETVEDHAVKRMALAGAVEALLGEAPGAFGPEGTYGREPAHIAATIGRGNTPTGLEKRGFVFGEYINADVYLPEKADADGAKLPGVLWLPPANAARGYGAAYHRDTRPHYGLARAGHAVLCFDPIGTGRRILEVQGFYERYPDWSVLGKMLRDAQDALEVFLQQPYVDPERVYVVGYGPGAMLALHLAALDERVAGVAAISPPQPFIRADLRHWSHDRMWLPQLGHFIGQEQRVPYDLSELMAVIAPRPLLVQTPALDWEVNHEDMAAMVEAVRGVYKTLGAGEKLVYEIPQTYNHFTEETQAPVIAWLEGVNQP